MFPRLPIIPVLVLLACAPLLVGNLLVSYLFQEKQGLISTQTIPEILQRPVPFHLITTLQKTKILDYQLVHNSELRHHILYSKKSQKLIHVRTADGGCLQCPSNSMLLGSQPLQDDYSCYRATHYLDSKLFVTVSNC
jgi:hypothetical protein